VAQFMMAAETQFIGELSSESPRNLAPDAGRDTAKDI